VSDDVLSLLADAWSAANDYELAYEISGLMNKVIDRREKVSSLTSDERATYQSLRARGFSHDAAIGDALDGVGVNDVREEGLSNNDRHQLRLLADLGVREQWPPDEWRAAIYALTPETPFRGAMRAKLDGHQPVVAAIYFGEGSPKAGVTGCSCLPTREYHAAGHAAGVSGWLDHLADALTRE